MRTTAIGVGAMLLGVALLAADISLAAGALSLVLGVLLAAIGLWNAGAAVSTLRASLSETSQARDALAEELASRQAERDQLERALASTGDIVIAVDRDTRVRYLNPAAERLLGLVEQPVRDAPLLDVVEDPDLYDAVRLADAEGTPAMLVVLRAERRYRTVVAPVSDIAETGPWSVVLAMHDLSDLYEAEIARRDFFINASHELRTPLSTISAAAETLELARKPADAQRFREIIQSEAGRMQQLVEEMLALARLESGLTEPQMETVAIESMIGAAVESIRPQASREGLSLTYDANGAGSTMVNADAELVERALLNLLHNAVKFTDAGGEIVVRSEHGDPSDPAPMVWIRVRDTGIGIEQAEQSRIFQRFYRVDRARQSGGGTGLGLAVVRHIAEVHGGAVSLESAPGAGSTFGFSIPLALSSVAEPSSTLQSEAAQREV